MVQTKKFLVSGIRPTGQIHLGNYFGALKQVIDLQDKYQCFIFIADLHALTSEHSPKNLSSYTLNLAIDFLSLGINHKKTFLFRQSDIYFVPKLSWILSCICPLNYLFRSHSYKQTKQEKKEINDGIFQYPVLMAADILLYGADIVPVGKDQKQHIEVSRFLGKKFNNIYGKTFKIPQGLILKQCQAVPGIDGRKMSKSYNNTIGLFDEPGIIREKVKRIVTDSKQISEPKNPEKCNIFALHKLVTPKQKLAQLRKRYIAGQIGYQESKQILAENIIKFTSSFREKRKYYQKNKNLIYRILQQGKTGALKQGQKIMNIVEKRIGLSQ